MTAADRTSLSFVAAFREAAPYIHYLRGKVVVLAISSHVIASPNFQRLAEDISLLSSLGIQLVLVHGVRHYIDESSRRQGREIRYHNDRRITDEDTIALAKEACGLVRFEIEAALSMSMANSPQHGVRTHIASGNFLVARPLGVVDGVDMGYTGTVRRIDADSIRERLNKGDLVLVSPIGHSYSGSSFNLFLEETAAHIAVRLKAEKLIFVGTENGIFDKNAEQISSAAFNEMIELVPQERSPNLNKILESAKMALDNGINRVHVLSGLENGCLLQELFTRQGIGTTIAQSTLVYVRQAIAFDISDILQLIRPLEEAGILKRRSREYLENHIDEFSVLEHDEQIYGCVALKTFADSDSAELACLVVSKYIRDEGYGEILLQHVLRQAKKRHLKKLFALTTHTEDWFLERGFTRANLEDLPQERQEEYRESKRGSKIFMLTL